MSIESVVINRLREMYINGTRVGHVAAWLEIDRGTVWRYFRQFREEGERRGAVHRARPQRHTKLNLGRLRRVVRAQDALLAVRQSYKHPHKSPRIVGR